MNAPQAFRRTRHTWLLYLAFAVFGYLINGLGPVTPFLKAELGLTYTQASLHFSAFAAGMIAAGLGGHLAAARLGRRRTLWFSLFGMCAGALGLAAGRSVWVTVGASFAMGCVGMLMAAVVPSGLSDEHGENRAIPLAELNLVAAVFSAAAPLLIGWFSTTALGWRFGLAVPLAAALLIALAFGRLALIGDGPRGGGPVSPGQELGGAAGRLPGRYWIYFVVIILVVAAEYCMVWWCADYMEKVVGLPKAAAAQAVSVFLAGLISGRVVCSRLLLRFRPLQVLNGSLGLAVIGFLLFWGVPAPWPAAAGLFLTGAGVAGLFPMTQSLALAASGGNTLQASTRAALASGIAVFVLPLVLGRLADAVGIRLAYGLVLALFLAAAGVVRVSA
jgi:fucose permease